MDIEIDINHKHLIKYRNILLFQFFEIKKNILFEYDNLNKIKKSLIIIKIIIISIFITLFSNCYYLLNIISTYKSENRNIENYLKICNNKKLINNKTFKVQKKPKISIISPNYNRGKYLLRFLSFFFS